MSAEDAYGSFDSYQHPTQVSAKSNITYIPMGSGHQQLFFASALRVAISIGYLLLWVLKKLFATLLNATNLKKTVLGKYQDPSNRNKAGYTATEVAFGWARAVMKRLI